MFFYESIHIGGVQVVPGIFRWRGVDGSSFIERTQESLHLIRSLDLKGLPVYLTKFNLLEERSLLLFCGQRFGEGEGGSIEWEVGRLIAFPGRYSFGSYCADWVLNSTWFFSALLEPSVLYFFVLYSSCYSSRPPFPGEGSVKKFPPPPCIDPPPGVQELLVAVAAAVAVVIYPAAVTPPAAAKPAIVIAASSLLLLFRGATSAAIHSTVADAALSNDSAVVWRNSPF